MGKPRKKSHSGIYHVMLRGNNKQIIFEDDEDYRKYLRVLQEYKETCEFEVLAYCLMSNHIHILMRPGEVSLAIVFQKIGAKYVRWYNTKYERVGHLFQDRYRSEPVDGERHVLKVVRYIHMNPVKAGICSKPEDYKYSSFRRYFSGNPLVDSGRISFLMDEKEFADFHNESNEDEFMDIDTIGRRSISDKKALDIMYEISGCCTIAEFQTLAKEQRNSAIKEMRKAGVSIRQASRLTGVSRRIVERCK